MKDTVANVRVYELAKELELSNHDLIEKLAELGVAVKSHSSSLDPETVELVKSLLKGDVTPIETVVESKPEIVMPVGATLKQIAKLLNVTTAEVQKALVKQGALVGVSQVVEHGLAEKVAESFGYRIALPESEPVVIAEPVVEQPSVEPIETIEIEAEEAAPAVKSDFPKVVPKAKPAKSATLAPRPPIVTILGHVDHGKTTLLDVIRKTNVTDQEFGGITQHIGAYQVEVKGKKITFLDTPGHAAFTAMRARGAQVTDIAILIVAADDGPMPQTLEALDHARAAGVHIIAAINKIDKPDANVQRTKQQLAEHGLVIEEWGGDTVSVDISAKSQTNINELLDMILLVSEIAEFKADPHGKVDATVIEAQLDKGHGPVATILVETGTLKLGDVVVVGKSFGKIKAMLDDKGNRLQKAGPAMPVEVVGLSKVPMAGDKLEVAKNEKEARQLAESRQDEERSERLASSTRITLADLYKQLQEGVVKDLNVILKADVQGSAEAIRQSLERLSTSEVRVNLIHGGVGNIGESDILLASASNAVVIGFNVRIDPQAKKTAEEEKIEVRTYQIIYELLDEVKAAMEGLLEPVLEETVIGHVDVRALFRLPKGGVIAGSYVTDGKALRNAHVRIIRNGAVVHTGKIGSLKHIKEDVKEMAAGFECGIIIDGFNDIQIGDTLEVFTIEEIARRI